MTRLRDLLAALVGLCLLAPVLLVAMLLVRLDSAGPAIFRQVRLGRNQQPFVLYKLRTMAIGTGDRPSHEVGTASLTRMGGRLRRWKLDELPQLVNVLRGDMALVGPRPGLPGQTALTEARAARGVFAVPPGITGLAQVQGIDMSDPQRLAAVDADYVRTRSFRGDLRLLLATLTGRGLNADRIAGPPDQR
jgi:O-antigen biosynthesis protein WbqP